jgi:hypothetical protein
MSQLKVAIFSIGFTKRTIPIPINKIEEKRILILLN